MKRRSILAFLLGAGLAFTQTPATIKQLMLDLIHPAANDILLVINRGGPANETEWATVRRSALTLREAGDRLSTRGPDHGDWVKYSKLLFDAGAAAYGAAQSKDAKALAALSDSLDASCTTCHKQYLPNVFPR